jgi:hypothetical protein
MLFRSGEKAKSRAQKIKNTSEAEGRAKMARRVAGRTHRAYLCLKSVRIFSKTFTILEIADSQAGALATPPPVASTLWAKFKFAESRRNKKNEEKRKN